VRTMEREEQQGQVLVIGSEQQFRKSVASILGINFTVLEASTESEGLETARTERPLAIVLGYLEPRGTSFNLHAKLRDGWITKHIPLVVVDVFEGGRRHKTWTNEEAMQMEAEDYISISTKEGEDIRPQLAAYGLLKTIDAKLHRTSNLLKEAILDPDVFCVTWEQIPGRGAFEIQQEIVIDNVRIAARSGKVHAVSVTDNPGGNPALSTEMLCAQIKKADMEPLVHLACRDKNRNEIESMLYGLAAEGVRNILILSGDYPSADGFEGMPKPVFDIDPVNALHLVGEMNRGLEHKLLNKTVTLAPTNFYAGVCVSPFKKMESELVGQYAKLKKKIDSGAGFIITQVGYDVRKLHEVLQWLRVHDYSVPVLANVYVLPYGVAKFMNRNGVPGCVVPDKLVAELGEEAKAEDKGRSARLLRAAKQYALAKGMGCAGAHIGGHGVTYEMLEYIVDKGEQLSRNWQDLVGEFDYPQTGGFYYFEKDEKTGLCAEKQAPRTARHPVPLAYRLSRLAHSLMFNEKRWYFKMFQRFAARVDSSPRATKFFFFFEHMAKVAMFGCMNCGDCALFDVAYVCPMSQCPKQQRNGPCGGSYEGWCEVHPNEKKCVWVQAYERLKPFKEEIPDYVVKPCNWNLLESSSWLNFYLGRDHTAKRLGITPPRRKTEKGGAAKT